MSHVQFERPPKAIAKIPGNNIWSAREMANVDFFSGQGFIGANLNWNIYFDGLGTGEYWDVCFIPNGTNENLTIVSKTFKTTPDGRLQLWVNYSNNSANDTYFSIYLIRAYD